MSSQEGKFQKVRTVESKRIGGLKPITLNPAARLYDHAVKVCSVTGVFDVNAHLLLLIILKIYHSIAPFMIVSTTLVIWSTVLR